ncbi:MAG TPA: biotin--[acetyl-CoA-carboxylase] ligase [Tepidisphaeraceae bacterium]|jgi:BirA family biotin operon repressor/biotin-[acetyl-CoA-carboxylase] ligase|nr:biotin--[acetyl-CoA-carboxylase] ligase [Tepidisphaeraceae bacterium]
MRAAAKTKTSQSGSFDLTRLKAGIRPFRLYFFPRLRSTNDHAALLRKRGDLFAPAIVLTPNQTAGRGRGRNTWWSKEGALTVTFALPIDHDRDPHQVPLIAGLAVRNAAAELSGDHSIGLKWPNDVVHDNKKLAGLLCERIDRVDLIGIGLNVNIAPSDAPRAIRNHLTSLLLIAGKPFDLTDVLLSITRQLLRVWSRRQEHPFGALLEEYDRYHTLTGRRVSIVDRDNSITGQCEGLDSAGRLLVRAKKLHRIVAGQVEMA